MRRAVLALLTGLVLLHAAPARAADPTTADCLAASDAALKAGNEHKLRLKRSQLLVCAAESCPTDIRKECAARVEDVNAEIPTIIFAAKDVWGNDVTGVKVTVDGELLTERLAGTALSIDPGEHTFTFELAGQTPLTKTFLIQQSQKDRRETVSFGSAPEAARPAPVPPGGAPATAPLQPLPASASPAGESGFGGQRIAAIVTAGAGVVGLGLGVAFGAATISEKTTAQVACPGSTCPTQAGSGDWSSAAKSGNVATAMFIAGGVAVAGGVVLWFTAPRGKASVQAGVAPGGLGLRGVW